MDARAKPTANRTTFMVDLTRINHLNLGNRHDQLAAPFGCIAQLGGDFLPQVPWQDQEIVGSRLIDG